MLRTRKMKYLRKILEEADKPLSAQQIGWRLPSTWDGSPHSVAAMLVGMENLQYINMVVGHSWKRFYYLDTNSKIINGELTKWQSLRI